VNCFLRLAFFLPFLQISRCNILRSKEEEKQYSWGPKTRGVKRRNTEQTNKAKPKVEVEKQPIKRRVTSELDRKMFGCQAPPFPRFAKVVRRKRRNGTRRRVCTLLFTTQFLIPTGSLYFRCLLCLLLLFVMRICCLCSSVFFCVCHFVPLSFSCCSHFPFCLLFV